jgi:hypothetical protein
LEYDNYGHHIKIHESLRNLIRKCWDDNPFNRPSAIEIYELLETLESECNCNEMKGGVLRRSMNKVAKIFLRKDSI